MAELGTPPSYQLGTAVTITVAKGVGEYVAMYLTPGNNYTFRVQTVSATGEESAGVAVSLQAPTNLTYGVNPAVYTMGVMIADNQPTSGGGAVDSYSVEPSRLPQKRLKIRSGVSMILDSYI